MADVGVIFTVFGGIFLFMTIINYIMMQKEVLNPNCHEDVEAVNYNKKWGMIYLIIYFIIVVIGVSILLFL